MRKGGVCEMRNVARSKTEKAYLEYYRLHRSLATDENKWLVDYFFYDRLFTKANKNVALRRPKFSKHRVD